MYLIYLTRLMTQPNLFGWEDDTAEPSNTKVCIWCGTRKQLKSFGLYNRNTDGRDNRCRSCVKHSTQVIKELKKTAPPKPEVCQCCGKPPKKKFVLDHCHDTETFRGWLCDPCNLAIGLLGDDLEGLQRAIKYLSA